jgi:hypothetical protein
MSSFSHSMSGEPIVVEDLFEPDCKPVQSLVFGLMSWSEAMFQDTRWPMMQSESLV